MSITPDSAKALLSSEDFGDRLQGINHLRPIKAEEAFELLQPVLRDSNARVRYAAMSLLGTVGRVDLDRSLQLLRVGLKDSESDVVAAAADAIAGLKLREGYEDLLNFTKRHPIGLSASVLWLHWESWVIHAGLKFWSMRFNRLIHCWCQQRSGPLGS